MRSMKKAIFVPTLLSMLLPLAGVPAQAAPPSPGLSHSEGSSGTKGGGGTELSLLGQIPERIEYRATYHWLTDLIPPMTPPGQKGYLQELQVRKVFVKAELPYANRGVHVEFWGRLRRGSGDWMKLPRINLVTSFSLIQLFQRQDMKQWTNRSEIDKLQGELQRGATLYLADGGTPFETFFSPLAPQDSLREYTFLASRIWRHEAKSYDDRFVPDHFEVWIDGQPSDRAGLEEKFRLATEVAYQGFRLDQPETLAPVVSWGLILRDLDSLDQIDPTDRFRNELKARVDHQAEALAYQVLDSVSSQGGCDLDRFESSQKAFQNWRTALERYSEKVQKTGIEAIYNLTSLWSQSGYHLISMVETALSLVRTYCSTVTASASPDSRSQMLQEIQAQKSMLRPQPRFKQLGDLVDAE